MSAEFPNQLPYQLPPFQMRRPIRPIQRPVTQTDANLMNAELNLDWENDINSDIWVSRQIVLFVFVLFNFHFTLA